MKNTENIDSDFTPFSGSGSGGGISVKEIVSKFAYHWPLFILTITLSLVGAYFYLATQENLYSIKATLQIKDGKSVAQREILEDIDLDKESKSAENEMEILRSQDLMVKVVNELNLWTDYSLETKFRQQSLYTNSPVKFELLEPAGKIGGQNLAIRIENDKTFTFIGADGKERKYPVGATLKSSFGKWKLHPNQNIEAFKGRVISIALLDPKVAATKYMRNMKVALVGKATPFIGLLALDAVPQRGEDVLNCLMKNYNASNLDEKVSLTKATLDFISKRIDSLSVDLGNAEKKEANFRSNLGLTSIEAESTQYLDDLQANDQRINEVEVQLAMLDNVEKYIKSGENLQGITTMGLTNSSLSAQLEKLSSLELEKERLLVSTPDNSPIFEPLNRQIALTKSAIKNNISNTKLSLLQSKAKLASLNSKTESSIKSLPGQEREYVNIKRKQTTKENLYVYLLNKREQIALNYATTISDSRIIESANAQGLYSPKTPQVYCMFLLIGLLLPAGIVFGRTIFNSKIVSRKDIEDKLEVPLLGEVIYDEGSESQILKSNERSAMAEHFKFLRTNLHYVHGKRTDGRINLVTSSVSGEGKSFVAANIAASLAASGRKTVLLELDLRKPKLLELFKLEATSMGISNYLDGSVPVNKIVRNSGLYSNLDIIECGTILPNPTELLEKDELDQLFTYLRTVYEDIVIDSPPLHLVADALILARLADVTLYVIRQGFTNKAELNFVGELNAYRRLPKMNIIFNGIRREKFGYGYNYDNSYYIDTKSKSFTLNKLAYNFLQRF